ncbi:trimeric intracellular cation channel family protein [Aliishimia ponticola]|uniref:Trimeric intracellular cation channel family protein n=1 Tax=Aliishimia ponticola TaxID=2499833 RepID=A0A4S4NHF8_9RHOB|nr:trimeric intracellular cation channel family protein [Aliishimia ponticola]THH39114.1 trimeric intracellular cation channel family protein [Aliishimia ponticola]
MTLPVGILLDLAGTFVFGISGAMLAVRRGLDVFGIAALAVAAALAGGMIRDMLLGAEPVAAFAQPLYLWAALAAAGLVFFAHRALERLANPVMLLDALGLGLFAVAGCRKALQFGLDPLPAILLGVLTAVGGGAVRDLLVTEVPRVLREEVYALAALVGAAIVVIGDRLSLPEIWVLPVGVLSAFLLRVLSVRRGWQAPKAPGSGSPD